MKSHIRPLFIALLLPALLPAAARADFVCQRVNGSYFVEIKARSVILTIVNASGVEDAQGELACDGPNEAAFLCEGQVRELDDNFKFKGPAHPAEVVVPESAAGGAGAGTFRIDGDLVRCTERSKL